MSVIALGAAIAGVILTPTINAAFYNGILAFGIGAVLAVAVLVCQFCFASSSMLRPDEDDETHTRDIRKANSRVITGTAGVLIGILACFAFILPVGIFGNSFYGINMDSAMGMGTGC